MITRTVSASKSTYLSVMANRLTVGHVLEFADLLRESNIPYDEMVTSERAHGTMHTTGLSCRHTEKLEVDE